MTGSQGHGQCDSAGATAASESPHIWVLLSWPVEARLRVWDLSQP
jgi:hypothetical protein